MQFWDLFWHSLFGNRDRRASDGQTESGLGVATLSVDAATAGAAAAKPAAQRWWTPGDDALMDIPPLARPELSTEALALAHALADCMPDAAQRLPTLSKATERLLRMLGRPQYSATAIADVLAQDQVLSAAVLRLANSALYGGREHIAGLRSAVARLSTIALQTIAMQYSLQAAVRSNLTRDRLLTELVWNGSLASAAIMRALAGCVGADPEEAYLIGLLHDIGNVLVVREVQDQQALLHYRLDVESFEWLCHHHHQTLGRLVAEAWELPDKVQALVADHHSPVTPHDPLGRERHMIALTDMTKAMLGYAPRRDYALLTSTPAAALGLTESRAFTALLDQLPSQLADIPAVC
jgi:putative nucleotidyltransferase with HDIG domain